jgi:dephospho-CoA kinase
MDNGRNDAARGQFVLALTGPIAAGKNAACDALARRGFACIDADVLVHEIIEERRDQIAAAFSPLARERGVEILKDGRIDRKALGSVLFCNPDALALQESIVHPGVREKTLEFLAAHRNQPCAVNATVLYKTGELLKRCACVLYIDAPGITRFFRVRRRNRLKSSQILQRIRSQSGLFSQYKSADADIFKVWNVGDLRTLDRKIGDFLTQCEKRGYRIWNNNEFYG